MGCYKEGNFEQNLKMCSQENIAKSRQEFDDEMRGKTKKGFIFDPSTGILGLPEEKTRQEKVVRPQPAKKVAVPRKIRGTGGHF